ncbi:MAG TPA: hypothetical protein VF711_11730, partial [Acidimicrobiales bacterium]
RHRGCSADARRSTRMNRKPSAPGWWSWKEAGFALATLVAIAGLLVLAFVIYFFFAFNSWANNK